MADKSEIFHFDLDLVDEACGLNEQLRLTIARHPSETLEHSVMRVMAYGLFWQPGIDMSSAVCQGDQPDLSVEQHAIVVGINNHKHIRKFARRYPRLSCLEWRQRHIDYAADLCQQIESDGATATIIGLEGDTDSLLSMLERRNRWRMLMTDDAVTVEVNAAAVAFQTRTLCRL